MDPALQRLIEALEKAGLGQSVSTNNRCNRRREQNRKMESDILRGKVRLKSGQVNEETAKLAEAVKKRFGHDIFSEKFEAGQSTFNWVRLREKLQAKFSEADSASSFAQFLRAGIINIATNQYEAVKTTYEDWVTVVPSGRDTELYTPNHGVSFPREVGRQQKYPEVGAAALDIKLRNRKYGSMYAIEWEFLEDDQTGSFQRNSALLGEYLKTLCEVLVYGKLASVANMRYVDFEIPTSETKPADEANYPWTLAAAPLIGGGVTKATPGGLTQANVQAGIIALNQQKNLLGIKMNVVASRLVIGSQLKFDAHTLLNSAYYPSGAAAAGAVGGAFAVNPLQGILDLTVTRFMAKNDGTFNGDSRAWYIVDDTHSWFVLQQREPIAVVQENPQSGASFEQDVYRFKGRSRKNADFIDPRFAWQGNDGSV